MRDPERFTRILALLGELWGARPDVRLGQLLEGVAQAHGPHLSHCLFHVEDEHTERCLREAIEAK
jgi:hypothetical protein